jgi:GDP-L-fucose synthase
MSADRFWAGHRVCVTGGGGFLGSYVVEKLRERGASSVLVPRSGEYDLVERGAIRRLLQEAQPTLVIHLAANVGGIGENQARPAEFFYDNLMMGVGMLHESWRSGVQKFVGVGTVCSYPKYTPVPFREDLFWEGYPEETNAPYGLAKKMLLVQSQAYRDQYGYNSIHLIPANLYGPRDDFDLETSHVIPALIRKCLEAMQRGEPHVVAWGDGTPTREFLYAADAAEGILLAAERYNASQPINLGTGEEISIRALAEMIADLTGFRGELLWDTSRPNGQPRRSLDVSRARSLLNFEAQTSLADGLRATIDWYRAGRPSEAAGAG